MVLKDVVRFPPSRLLRMMAGKTSNDFKYLTTHAPAEDQDFTGLAEVQDAIRELGITIDEERDIFRALGGLLHLGQVQGWKAFIAWINFALLRAVEPGTRSMGGTTVGHLLFCLYDRVERGGAYETACFVIFPLFPSLSVLRCWRQLEFLSDTGRTDDASKLKGETVDSLGTAADLLGLSTEDLSGALLTRPLQVAREKFVKPNKVGEAQAARDALAKDVYLGIFNYLLKKINEATR